MSIDHLRLHTMTFYAHHGVSAEERRRGQTFEMEVELALDLRAAGERDDLAYTVDYPEVYKVVQETTVERQFNLIEALAEAIATEILTRFPIVEAARVWVRKLSPPIGGLLDAVEVDITRGSKQ